MLLQYLCFKIIIISIYLCTDTVPSSYLADVCAWLRDDSHLFTTFSVCIDSLRDISPLAEQSTVLIRFRGKEWITIRSQLLLGKEIMFRKSAILFVFFFNKIFVPITTNFSVIFLSFCHNVRPAHSLYHSKMIWNCSLQLGLNVLWNVSLGNLTATIGIILCVKTNFC